MLMRPGPEPPVQLRRLDPLQRFGFRSQQAGNLDGQGTSSTTGKEGDHVVIQAYPCLAPLLWDLVVGHLNHVSRNSWLTCRA